MTPSGWSNALLASLAEPAGLFCDGDWVESKDQDPDGDVRLVQLADIGDGTFLNKSNRYLSSSKAAELKCTFLEAGDILIARMPDPLARACIFPGDSKRSVTAVDVCITRPAPDVVDPYWLLSAINSPDFRKMAQSLAGGSTRNRITRKNLGEIEVLVPPLPEQKKIAAILGSVDDAIQATQAVIDQTRKVKQGLLQRLLTRGIGHTRFKQTVIGEIPEGWQVLPAEEVCDAVIDCKNRTPLFTDVGYPVVRTPNVRDGRFVTTDLKFTDRESYEEWTKRGKPRPGDVLITREAPIGEVCLIPDGLDVCLGQRMMLYRPNPQLLDNRFMLMALLSPLIQERLILLAGGSTVGHVRVGDIRNLLIPVPPLDEQRQIASVIGAVDESLDSALLRLETMISLKTGLMADLITGRKRVEVSA